MGNVVGGSKGEDGPEPVRRLGHEHYERAAGAVPAQVDALRIDVWLFRQEVRGRHHIIDFTEESLDNAGVVVPAP